MSYILHILTPYRYPILAGLSLLLIAEMALAGVDLVPIEYEGALGWLMFLTILAWAGIAVVIGVAAPAGGDAPKDAPKQRAPNIYVPDFSVDEPGGGGEPKRRGHIIWILSPALFATLVLLAIWGANIFQAQFLLDFIRLPYISALIMVWIGMVVIVGATANVESSKKTYLIMNVFPLLALLALSLTFLLFPIGALFIILSVPLVIGVVVRRNEKSWITVAVATVGISVVYFVLYGGVLFIGSVVLFAIGPTESYSSDHPGVAVGIFASFLLGIGLLALTNSVFATVLIGTMRRPIRNITVAGIGMAAMILVSGWYWLLSLATM